MEAIANVSLLNACSYNTYICINEPGWHFSMAIFLNRDKISRFIWRQNVCTDASAKISIHPLVEADHIQIHPVTVTWWAIIHKGVTLYVHCTLYMHFSVIHLINLQIGKKKYQICFPFESDWCHCVSFGLVSNHLKVLIQLWPMDWLLKVFKSEKGSMKHTHWLIETSNDPTQFRHMKLNIRSFCEDRL